jgi:hypothetical protein
MKKTPALGYVENLIGTNSDSMATSHHWRR